MQGGHVAMTRWMLSKDCTQRLHEHASAYSAVRQTLTWVSSASLASVNVPRCHDHHVHWHRLALYVVHQQLGFNSCAWHLPIGQEGCERSVQGSRSALNTSVA